MFDRGTWLRWPTVAVALVVAGVWAVVAVGPSQAESMRCERIRVESRDRASLISSYVVNEPEFVSRMRLQIDLHGQDGVWVVAAGDLGPLGYTVTYVCLP
jgi:hypothetical protein